MDKQRLTLLLMSESEESQILILCLVYRTINTNPGITVNQICTLMYNKFFVSRNRIEGAIASLTNVQSFDCISTYEEKAGVIHLRCKNSKFDQFMSNFCVKVPEACLINVPKYERGGENRVNSSFKKV